MPKTMKAKKARKNSIDPATGFTELIDSGPGSVINPYLPQPGQHIGRRIIKIEDTPDSYWLDTASTSGTSWAEHFGVEKDDEGTWEIRNPESLTTAWFGARSAARPSKLTPAIRQVQVNVTADAQDQLATTGSLRNWSQGRAGTLSRGGTMTTARLSSSTDGTPVPPDFPEVDLETDEDDEKEKEDATNDFQASIAQLDKGLLHYPSTTWGGGLTDVVIDVEADPDPKLFLIQVVGISSFLGDYGLGRTVKTFTLLPNETAKISTKTWRSSEESISRGSSIVDSYDEASSERFAETVMAETTDTATRSKTENWHAEAEVKGSIGIASGSVSGGGSGEYSSGTEEFSKAVDESVNEHAAESSSHRENQVTSSSESTVSTGEEEVIERTISNINVGHTLTTTFRELNQVYTTKTHLMDVRIAFSNGNVGTWREEPISGIRRLIEEVIRPEHVDQVCKDIIKTIAIVHDVNGTPTRVLEQVRLDKCSVNFRVHDAEPDDKCDYPAPTADGRLYYRFKRGPLGQAPDEDQTVNGVLMKQRDVVMATDSVAAESLLGIQKALDEYSENLQNEKIRAQQLANAREELAQAVVAGGDEDKARIYATVFCCEADDEDSAETGT